jgi:hypothetical protein
MTKRQGPFRLVLNEAAAHEIEWCVVLCCACALLSHAC